MLKIKKSHSKKLICLELKKKKKKEICLNFNLDQDPQSLKKHYCIPIHRVLQ